MRNPFKNTAYYIKEAKTIFKVDLSSNILSILSIGLIFFILTLILTGWLISNNIVEIIEKETEISIYYNEGLEKDSLDNLLTKIGNIQGIRDAKIVSEDESYDRMVDILGMEAKILNHFENNPFSSFIEVKIEMESLDHILNELEYFQDIDYIRDNRQVIDRLQGIISIIEVLGLILFLAIGICTMIIISHIIRQGIYNNRDEIYTLKLLGAPDGFIQLPFFMEGLFLTIIGGGIAGVLWFILIKLGYGNIYNLLPFMPLPHGDEFVWPVITFLTIFSTFVGIIGSRFGLKSIK
ncbi:MAG: FtsX-like permease family protein [Tissierella sp.]|nr:FtsX-like permease family protein [Tissierella sp.]